MSDIGKWFHVKTEDGMATMKCVEHTGESRVLECDKGSVDIDWMEWMDQRSLGRIVDYADGWELRHGVKQIGE